MKNSISEKLSNSIILFLILIAIISLLEYQNYYLSKNNLFLKIKLSNTKTDLASTSKELLGIKIEQKKVNQKIDSELKNISFLTSQVTGITNSVDTLNKLAKTDPELLKKYSKVYFLNENYFPPNLTMIKEEETINPQKDLWFRKDTLPFLENLINDAKKSNINLKVLSAFRSFETQSELKTQYSVTYGTSAANKFSADQGFSEHQLGTAVDFTTTEIGSNLESFKKEKAYEWLKNNAYKYGFILSYPENNSYYQFEPWHWRFVGKKLAKKIYDNNESFYNLNQREIDSYLIYLFDK